MNLAELASVGVLLRSVSSRRYAYGEAVYIRVYPRDTIALVSSLNWSTEFHRLSYILTSIIRISRIFTVSTVTLHIVKSAEG